MQHLKFFEHITKKDVAIAGGKGASLGEMSNAKIPVPPGFVVLANAFDRFISETGLKEEIIARLKEVDPGDTNTVDKASNILRDVIHDTPMPKDLTDEILKAFDELGAEHVAVRSSATAEDSVSAAWAGQLESYLSTTGENLFENVKKCWASLFTPRAIFYRFEKGLHKQKISVAVVVQKMVESEISGIIFSVHPVTQNRDQIVIEAGFGLGEAIVSGKITPDTYVVEKNSWNILDKNINKGEIQKLSDEEIIELAKLATKIEKHFGFPVDIEWAKEKKIFYITQSRPITTISNISANNQNTLDYIKSQKWFFGVRADESLLFYSAKTGGYEYVKQKYGISFAETILIPLLIFGKRRIFMPFQMRKF